MAPLPAVPEFPQLLQHTEVKEEAEDGGPPGLSLEPQASAEQRMDHPADEGWKIFVFTHAPPNGSGLRVLQENHVVNGCCWLNHSNDAECRKFIELVREHRCIKGWFSGHFHLGQDYQDSITFP